MTSTQRKLRNASARKYITRAEFNVVLEDIPCLKDQYRTNLRRCAELQVDVDRLNKRAKTRGFADAPASAFMAWS
jgi:hypothetical protein